MCDNESELVTHAIVEAALVADKGPEVQLCSWAFENLISGVAGHTSNIRKIKVKYILPGQAENEVSYVAKMKFLRRDSYDAFFNVIHEKECSFYGEVIPALNAVLRNAGQDLLGFPKCFYQNKEPGREVIILENLRDQGYKMQDKTAGIDVAHTLLVLKELAKLHAASFLLQEKIPDEDLYDKFSCLQREWTREFNVGVNFEGFAGGNLDIGVAVFEKIGGCETVVEWIKKIKPRVVEMYEEEIKRTSPFAAITHADPWINNFLFRYDASGTPVDVKLLDLQGTRMASVALDLQHLFNMNLLGHIRRPNHNLFMKSYFTAFTNIMESGGSKAPFGLEDLMKEYRARGFYGLLYSIMWHPNMVRQPEDEVDILDQEEGAKRSEKDNVLRTIERLKPRLLSVVEEWTEFGIIG